jgi:hypothetical protein
MRLAPAARRHNVQAAADGLTNCRSQHSTLLLPIDFMLTIDFKLPVASAPSHCAPRIGGKQTDH